MKFYIKNLLCLSFIFGACQSQNTTQNQDYTMSDSRNTFAYVLESPSVNYTMPFELEEISGLSYFGNKQIACVQDENGYVFIFDEASQKVSTKYKFAKKGDYEGVELVRNSLYVVRNDGTVYEFELDENTEYKAIKYSTFLTEKDNIEGLGFDKKTNQLLLACKGSTNKKTKKHKREVYAFDLNTKTLLEDPFLIINFEDIANFLGEDTANFNTSGIAIHPITGEFYMISSTGKKLIVTDRNGFILNVQALSRDIFSQPEGICFDAEGTLYISNEARGGQANILKFEYLKK
jgi:uncharacterized protein YjiK